MKKVAYTALVTSALALMSSGAIAAGQDEYSQNRDMYRQQSQSTMGGQMSAMEPAAGGEHLSKSQVSQLQQTLKQQGFDPGPVDGVLGQQTKDAIRQFQQANGLNATGQLTSETATELGMSDVLSGSQQMSAMEPAAGGEQLSKSQVSKLQQTLQQQGFDPGPVDGVFGQQTRDAIRQFQQANDMDATGQLNSETATRLGMSDVLGGSQQQDWQQQREMQRQNMQGSPDTGSPDTGSMGGGSGY